jgi:molybdate transport system substrate-binding protein
MKGLGRAVPLAAVLGLALPVLAASAGSRPVEIVVYAAASLRDVLQQVAPECEKTLSVRLVFNFGPSNDLARQIQAANKADLFFSADEVWMDRVAEAGLLDTASRRSPLSNRLVVVGFRDASVSVASPSDLVSSQVRRISLANPEAVPAGKYAKSWLVRTGVWESIKERVVPELDVRAALAAVESGAAEVGVVYRTDAAIAPGVRVLYEVPESEGPHISYALAALKDRPHLAAARSVVDWLSGSVATAAFERSGFVVQGQVR